MPRSFSYPHFDAILFFTMFSKGLTQCNLVQTANAKIHRKVRQFIQGRPPSQLLGKSGMAEGQKIWGG